VNKQREKIFNIPAVIVWFVLLLVGIEAVRELLPPERDLDLVANFGFVPGRFTFAFDPDRIAATLTASADATQAELERFFLGSGHPLWWTPLTYSLLHAGWMHVGLNCLWLVPFGAAVARRFGNLRFVLFCVATAIAGALAHYVTHMTDLQPVIGASAIVSGMMGAALRFVFQPGAGFLLGSRDRERPPYRVPPLALRDVIANRTALAFLLLWFGGDILFGIGIGATSLGMPGATVAWQAHIGGFLFGLLCFALFDPPADAPRATNPLA